MIMNKLSFKAVGLDTERAFVSTANGIENKVALLRLCSGAHCLIVQLLHLESVSNTLANFLSCPHLSFSGVGIGHSLTRLRRDYGLECRNGIELGSMAASALVDDKYRVFGLVDLADAVSGVSVNKPSSTSLSDWSGKHLTPQQIQSATFGAYVSYVIATTLLQRKLCRFVK
uniref:3'-5' exonuclease domain-containing protein n=1 Tax=Nelumbo nucifera TaxID=4432 RepID=A0A822Z0P4_NELNU|nr:TPA_asm: hypothetical protein HUJ06_008951 [Nelumbo nucifera]